MPPTVLIVEDEQSASRLLASIAAEVGLSTRATASAREAQELCAQAAGAGQAFAAVILDLVLTELDGFQFATAARAQPWGAALPLVVISGVYKTLPPEMAARIKPAAFFAKPFEPAQLRETLKKVTGVDGIKAQEGNIAEKPVAALFVELLRNKSTGTLTLTQESTKRVVTFQQGMVRFAQSNLKAEAVGAPLVASGAIKQTSFDRAVALARQQGISLHEALASARVVTPEQLKGALKQQTSDAAVNGMTWAEGSFRFEQKAVDAVSGVPDVRTSPVALVLEGAKRHGDPSLSRKWLEARAQERLTRSPELERELFSVKAFFPGESVTPMATTGKSVGEVLARVKDPELPLFHYLCLSGLLQLTAAGKVAGRPHPGAPAGAADEDRGKIFSAPETATRRMLFGERDHFKDASHYDVLAVTSDATVEEIKKQYFLSAKKFHSDSFSGMELGSARKVAEELFSKVNEAYQVLSDKEKRAEYDVYLDRKAKGLPTDVGAILRAEGVFQKGEALFKMGRYEDAEVQFREAVALNHAEAEFHAYLGMVIFKRTGKADDGLQHVEKALEMDPRLRSGVMFAAQLLEAQGEVDRARTLLRKAFDKDPEFTQANDELRRMKNKPAEQTKGGFFSRLLKK